MRGDRVKLCLEFNINKTYLPIDYRSCFVSWIKKALSIGNEGKYFEQYYRDTVEKPFTFAVVMNKPKFSKEKVCFEGNRLRVYFSVTDRNRTSLIFLNCFLKMKYLDFKLPQDNVMCLVNVRQLESQIIQEDRALLQTVAGSSIVLREHNKETNKDKYYTCEDEGYIEKLEESIKRQCLRNGYTEQKVQKIKVNSVQGKKVVVKHYNVLIDGVSGVFDISAPKEILNELYTVGFGARKSFGFSFVDVVNTVKEA